MDKAKEKIPLREELKERLRRFLEVRNDAKILDKDNGTLKMHILHSKTKKKKIVDKMINYNLLRLAERLLTEKNNITDRDAIICEFLLEELEKYLASKLGL